LEKLKFIYSDATYTVSHAYHKTGEMIPVKHEQQTPEELAALLKELRAEIATLTCNFQYHNGRERHQLDQISGLNPDLSLYTKERSLLFEYTIEMKLEKHNGNKPVNFVKRFAVINVSVDVNCELRKAGILNDSDMKTYYGSTKYLSFCRPLMFREPGALVGMSGSCDSHSKVPQEWETKEWCTICRGQVSPDKLTAILNKKVDLSKIPDSQIKFIGTKVIPIDWDSSTHIDRVVELMKADQALIKAQTEEIKKIDLQKVELYGKIAACDRDKQIATDKIDKIGHGHEYCETVIKIAEVERVRIAEEKKQKEIQNERIKLLEQLASLDAKQAQNTDTLRKIHTGTFEIKN
jgi:hypothetical protein